MGCFVQREGGEAESRLECCLRCHPWLAPLATAKVSRLELSFMDVCVSQPLSTYLCIVIIFRALLWPSPLVLGCKLSNSLFTYSLFFFYSLFLISLIFPPSPRPPHFFFLYESEQKKKRERERERRTFDVYLTQPSSSIGFYPTPSTQHGQTALAYFGPCQAQPSHLHLRKCCSLCRHLPAQLCQKFITNKHLDTATTGRAKRKERRRDERRGEGGGMQFGRRSQVLLQ